MSKKKIVEYVSELARIRIDPQEKECLGNQLSRIIDYIDKLKELDAEDVIPMRGLHIERNVFREDKAGSFESKKSILDNAPLREGDYFKIPKVIE
ncbi:MAG: Asp-tRNA(Asn)/Glu-tRNA(Gln) amidotransferase subunit GatC [Candidatus Omnitrophica bacterium]|nr:Asp-tRNA(Asn)/Glu-tRNA(Gln) amidotransferase subunit GatC [Candidatus Omnitrophota bacterium]MBD3269583.1 Asp-tRNA(Asn)/Glu-tRNA(Gln) amidotransferase subunit GatC [Candidatus Omnitrophota bacterium]